MTERQLEQFFDKHRQILSDAAIGNKQDEDFILADMLDEFEEQFPHCDIDVNTQNDEVLVYDAIGEIQYTFAID